MSPVHLAVLGDDPARVPIVDAPFWIGRDPGCDLCLWDLRISRKHAKLARTHGEYLLSSEGRHGVYVNGTRVTVLALRDGDEISLTPPGEKDAVRLRFEDDLRGTFVPPGVAISTAWVERVKAEDSEPTIVTRYETLGLLEGTGPTAPRLVRERATGREAVLSIFPPVPVGTVADAWLRLVATLAGAEHPNLARVVDGGIEAVEEGALRWLVSNLARGRTASVRIPEGPQSAVTVARRLRALTAGLHLLHDRGVVHGSVVPAHVILKPDGGVTLVGYGRSFLRRDGAFPGATPPPESAYLPPETQGAAARLPSPAADVYGLAATGLGLLLGRAPFDPADAAHEKPVRPADLGLELAPALEEALLRGLERDPADRPTAEDLGQVLAFVEASLARTAPS